MPPSTSKEFDGPQQEGSPLRRILAWTIGALFLTLLIVLASKICLLLFTAVLFAVFLHTLSDRLHKHSRLPPIISLIAVVLLLACAAGALFWLIAPSVSEQIDRLATILPSLFDRYTGILEKYEWSKKLPSLPSSAGDLVNNLGGVLAGVTSFFSGVADIVVSMLLIAVVGLYLAAESRQYVRGVVNLFPAPRRARVEEIFGVVGSTIRGWLLGQMVSMLFLGVFSFIGLSLLGIPLALTLALFTALLTFIPNLGPIISVIPPLLLALTQSPMRAVAVLLFYVALQNIEGNFVTPLVMRHVIKLPPALLISSQILAATLFGFFGLMLAAPMVAVAIVLVKLLYLEDVLGEKIKIPGYESGG